MNTKDRILKAIRSGENRLKDEVKIISRHCPPGNEVTILHRHKNGKVLGIAKGERGYGTWWTEDYLFQMQTMGVIIIDADSYLELQ